MKGALGALTETHAKDGVVHWIGIRPERRAPVEVLEHAMIEAWGLSGDRRAAPGKRAVTLVQAEHLPVIAALCGVATVEPALLRRNLVISGINLLALRRSVFRVGQAVLRGTGLCAPCSRMEATLGPGGYNAVRGHGGITAEVLVPGSVMPGDAVSLCEPPDPGP